MLGSSGLLTEPRSTNGKARGSRPGLAEILEFSPSTSNRIADFEGGISYDSLVSESLVLFGKRVTYAILASIRSLQSTLSQALVLPRWGTPEKERLWSGLRGSRICFAALAWVFVPLLFSQPQTTTSPASIGELFQAARQAEHSEDFSTAVKIYREIVKQDPRIGEVWSNLGMALYHLDRNAEAVLAFEKAASLKPRLLAPHLFAGLAYLKMGAAQKALAPLKAALALEPGQPEARLALA